MPVVKIRREKKIKKVLRRRAVPGDLINLRSWVVQLLYWNDRSRRPEGTADWCRCALRKRLWLLRCALCPIVVLEATMQGLFLFFFGVYNVETTSEIVNLSARLQHNVVQLFHGTLRHEN